MIGDLTIGSAAGAAAGAIVGGTTTSTLAGAAVGGASLTTLGLAEQYGGLEVPGFGHFGLSGEIDLWCLAALVGAVPGALLGAGIGGVRGGDASIEAGARIGAGVSGIGALAALAVWTWSRRARDRRCAAAGNPASMPECHGAPW